MVTGLQDARYPCVLNTRENPLPASLYWCLSVPCIGPAGLDVMTRQEGRRQTPTGGKESCSGCSDTAASHQRSEGGGTNRPGWEAGRKPHRYWHEDRKTPCVFSLPHTATRGRCEPSGGLLKLLACCLRTHRQTHRHSLSPPSATSSVFCITPTPLQSFYSHPYP